MKKTIITLFAALPLAAAAFAGQMPDNKVLVLKTKDGLALQGYGPVAYFTGNKPVKGTRRSNHPMTGQIIVCIRKRTR